MDTATGTPSDIAGCVADRIERLSRLTPDDGLAFDLSLAQAQRLLAYAGFSLFRAARALERRPAGQAECELRPVEVPA